MGNAETTPLHFTLKLADQGIMEVRMAENLHGILFGTQYIMFCGLSDFVSSVPQRGGSSIKPRDHDISKSRNL